MDLKKTPTSAAAMQLFRDRAATVSKTGSVVAIQCENGDDANAVFYLLVDRRIEMFLRLSMWCGAVAVGYSVPQVIASLVNMELMLIFWAACFVSGSVLLAGAYRLLHA